MVDKLTGAIMFLRKARAVSLAGLSVAALLCAANPSPVGAQPPPVQRRTTKTTPDHLVKFVIQNRGYVVVDLYWKTAPKACSHFITLVRNKFYDRLLFHHVVAGFMASTGDPHSRSVDGKKLAGLSDLQVSEKFHLGMGGTGARIPLEPKGYHERGTLGLQHSIRNLDTGDSVIFFNLDDNPYNNGAYTVFGRVTEGLDVLNKIKQGDRIESVRIIPDSSKH